MVYNMRTARDRRLAATGENWQFYGLDGNTFTLPREVPLDAVEAVQAARSLPGAAGLRLILAALLGPEQSEQFDSGALSAEDIAGLLEAYGREVGVSLGESKSSATSSPSTATRSTRTSKRSTASTSPTSGAAR